MARSVTPGSLHSDDSSHYGRSRFFVTDLVSRYGLRAAFALLIPALLAFAPLTTLYWLQVVPREWTRDQIAAVRNALPDDAHAARTHLSQLVDRLGWREFLQGWFCYAVAGITGLGVSHLVNSGITRYSAARPRRRMAK